MMKKKKFRRHLPSFVTSNGVADLLMKLSTTLGVAFLHSAATAATVIASESTTCPFEYYTHFAMDTNYKEDIIAIGAETIIGDDNPTTTRYPSINGGDVRRKRHCNGKSEPLRRTEPAITVLPPPRIEIVRRSGSFVEFKVASSSVASSTTLCANYKTNNNNIRGKDEIKFRLIIRGDNEMEIGRAHV